MTFDAELALSPASEFLTILRAYAEVCTRAVRCCGVPRRAEGAGALQLRMGATPPGVAPIRASSAAAIRCARLGSGARTPDPSSAC
ncbi:hypothetical protein GCM10022287_03340 [Gryllotalpicola koreensis]|uniref:Uncharacterized protein n=1 Tax=Gryllotalpicola koreensis TaxID=993086 RepID=A0ABP7ZR33_9MICO